MQEKESCLKQEAVVMSELFTPNTKEEFLASVDRGLAQLDAGAGRDVFESFDDITSQLEAGYKAMKATQESHKKKAVALS